MLQSFPDTLQSATKPFGTCIATKALCHISDPLRSDKLPFAVVQLWWPLVRPQKYGQSLNLFGTWLPGAGPTTEGGTPQKKHKASGTHAHLLVDMKSILVWPIQLRPGQEGWGTPGKDSGCIPFAALHYLKAAHDIDIARPRWCFSGHGKKFLKEAAELVGQHHASSADRG